jgi:hypothetical protein
LAGRGENISGKGKGDKMAEIPYIETIHSISVIFQKADELDVKCCEADELDPKY